jgi:AbrB family looped-hinge helix DNA binding protein
MKITIDRAGRIVVPEHIRDVLGLVGGQELELSATLITADRRAEETYRRIGVALEWLAG